MFESVKVDGVGYGVCWDGELDLSSDGIYLREEHIAKTDADPRLLLGQIVSNAREEASLIQRELSKRSGVMQAEISRIERGKGDPTLLTLQKLAKSLGRTVASLLIWPSSIAKRRQAWEACAVLSSLWMALCLKASSRPKERRYPLGFMIVNH